MQKVAALLPSDRSLSLAEALADASPSKPKAQALLDAKAQKYVRRWLEKRRNVYRDRRISRVAKLLQDLTVSEQQYLSVLSAWIGAKSALATAGATPEEILLVLGEVERASTAHQQLVNLSSQV
jgi:uncharacterized protein YjiS (DUF1127 family)